jgi:hypothetical protein
MTAQSAVPRPEFGAVPMKSMDGFIARREED